jgi:NitT/TauT family transport system substrate-binding protein
MVRTIRACAAILLFLVATQLSARAETKLVIASANTSIGHLAFRVAQSQGYFAAEGLKPEVFDFRGGGPAIQALAGGGADACLCSGDHVVWLANHGIKARVLVAITGYYSYGLVTRASSPYTDLKSLKGQSIGVTSSGSASDNMARYAVRKIGLNPDTDFTVIGAGTTSAMVPAIDTGAVAAGMVTTPDFQFLMYSNKDKYRTVEDFTVVPYLTNALVVTDDWLKKNPETARALARAAVRGLQLVHSDPAAVAADLKKTYPQFDDPFVADMVKLTQRNLSTDGKLTEVEWQSVNTIVTAFDPELKQVPLADASGAEFLPSAN